MRNTVMTHKGFKRLRAWLMLVVLALPLTLTAPIAHADDSTIVGDYVEGLLAYGSSDYNTALENWRPLAKQGVALAQYNLALMYYHGEGVERDLKEAARLYRLAAEQGVASAQNNLGVMYKNGEGVFQDLEKSYMWLTLAWVNGDEKAPEARHLVKQQMRLDFSLGDVAIKRTEKAARQCYDSNYQDCGR